MFHEECFSGGFTPSTAGRSPSLGEGDKEEGGGSTSLIEGLREVEVGIFTSEYMRKGANWLPFSLF